MALPESLITALSVYLHDLIAQRKSLGEVITNLESFVRLVTPPTKLKTNPRQLVRVVAVDQTTLTAVGGAPKTKKRKGKGKKKGTAKGTPTATPPASTETIQTVAAEAPKPTRNWTPEARRKAALRAKKMWKARKAKQQLVTA